MMRDKDFEKNERCENVYYLNNAIALDTNNYFGHVGSIRKPIHKKVIVEEFINTYLCNPAENTKKTYRCVLYDFLKFISPNGDVISEIGKNYVIAYINSKTDVWNDGTMRTKCILISSC